MLTDQQGKYIGYLAIALSIIGFFIWGIPLGIIAMILSAIGVWQSDIKGLNWNSLALGSICVIIALI
ncbi:Uncharacterised protein [Alloiococcus otitis]|uniref:DUF4190 domain-containing protein n=1 Tax=Alloiococcus otitis ATCC 51267 TaxID=883081 RepID=K9EA75_9LACT|nr:hypothetical protein [Alloiococcus otitis]EKU93603.1 hypothetical protein HMPREF9698_00898 [Alloiococcus otitis ATCC 51267]SUU80380.1 Uncharacterised protein [Alloiococcus otitis]